MAEKIYATFTTSTGVEVKVIVSGRRRYGNTMMTWLYCGTNENDQQFMGDPWPMNYPPISGLLWQLRCMGYDITPSSRAIEYAKKMNAEKLNIVMSPEDRITYALTKEQIPKFVKNLKDSGYDVALDITDHQPTPTHNPISKLLTSPTVSRFLKA